MSDRLATPGRLTLLAFLAGSWVGTKWRRRTGTVATLMRYATRGANVMLIAARIRSAVGGPETGDTRV